LLSQDPEALESALGKLEQTARQVPVPPTVTPAQANLFIVNPYSGRNAGQPMANLFSTHPPTPQRMAPLEEIRKRIAQPSGRAADEMTPRTRRGEPGPPASTPSSRGSRGRGPSWCAGSRSR